MFKQGDTIKYNNGEGLYPGVVVCVDKNHGFYDIFIFKKKQTYLFNEGLLRQVKQSRVVLTEKIIRTRFIRLL